MKIQLSDHFSYGRLLRFVLPSVVMMIFTSIYSVVDGLFVSNFTGKEAFAAINLIMPCLQIFGCPGFMLGTGGSALVAMTLGTGDRARANRLFSLLAVTTVAVGLGITVAAMPLLRPLATVLGASGPMLENCLLYGRIILLFQTAFMLQCFFQSFFIAAEKPHLGLGFTVAAGLTNMVLDFVFVALLHGGLVGAAAATVMSQLVGGVLPALYFLRKDNGSLLHFVPPQWEWRALLKACANGASELMTNLSASVVGALYNWQLLRLAGADGVAAYGVIMYTAFIFVAIFFGYSQGCAPIISYHYGADNRAELQNLHRKSMVLVSLTGLAMFAGAELLASPLAQLFVGYDAALASLTVHAMRIYGMHFVLCGFNIFGSAFFTALNNGFISAVLAFSRLFLFQAIMVVVLPALFGLEGIWYSVVAAEVGAFAVTMTFLAANRKRYGY